MRVRIRKGIAMAGTSLSQSELGSSDVFGLTESVIEDNPRIAEALASMNDEQANAAITLAVLVADALEAEEHFCPHCGAILDDQDGFDPENGFWRCAICGTELYGDAAEAGARYPGVFWYCDGCGSFLNEQAAFSDALDEWTCAECGRANEISEEAVMPGCSGDYSLFGVFRNAGASTGQENTAMPKLPPMLAKRQIELLQAAMPGIDLSSPDPAHWSIAAKEVVTMLETSGRNDAGIPNSIGIICQSILFLLKG